MKLGRQHNEHKGQAAERHYTNQPARPLWLLRRWLNFASTYRGVNACWARCLNSVLNVKAVVGAFNQEKALVGAFSVITNLRMELFEALVWSVEWGQSCRGSPLIADIINMTMVTRAGIDHDTGLPVLTPCEPCANSVDARLLVRLGASVNSYWLTDISNIFTS